MIRPLVASDIPAVKRIIDATALFPSDIVDEMAHGYLGTGETGEFWLVAEDSVDVVGVAYCAPERMTKGTWNLYLIAVHTEAQRQGHGSALIGVAESRAMTVGGRVLLIETSGLADFAAQRTFYRGLGYREEARIREFYRAGEDKVVFWKHVALTFRLAQEEDVAALQAIELDAARSYAALPETRFCLELPARSAAEHALARGCGLALVAKVRDEAVGFALVVPKDGRAHLLELAVCRTWQGKGCGRRLIAAVEAWARAAGFGEVTLTTFKDVAWNAPLYRRLGYRNITVGPDRPEFAKLLEEERQAGFHRAPRVAMAKEFLG